MPRPTRPISGPTPAHADLIRLPAQVRALVAPTRQEILDALESAGPRSVAELADLLGRAPDSLYFHLRRLVKVGLVAEIGRRKSGRHVALVYDAAHRPARISYARPITPALIVPVVAAAMRLGMRDFERALAPPTPTIPHDPSALLPGPRRAIWGARTKGWVTRPELARINTLLNELTDVIRRGRPGPNRTPVGLSFVLAPASPSKRRTRTATKEARS